MNLFRQTLRLVALPLVRNTSSFESRISLCHLYPKSSLSLTTPINIPKSATGFSGFIPIEKLEISYCKSSGPGGQNVNKIDTKVDIRFHVETADWLNEEIKKNITSMYKNRINKEGFIVIRSEKTRSQHYNQADAITILRDIIKKAATPTSIPPSEETLHLLRKRKEKANRERLSEKRMHSLKKQRRDGDAII